jgi:hypothetical protein
MPYLFRSLRSGGHAAVGIGGQASDGRLCAGSYEVTPPGRSRATTSSAGPTDRPKDSNPCVRLTESQTRRKTPATSSLAYGCVDLRRCDRTNLPSMRMLHLGLRVSDLEQSLAFYSALGYAELGSVPETEFGSLTMLQLPDDPSSASSSSTTLSGRSRTLVPSTTWSSRWTIWMPRSQTSRQGALRLRRRLSRDRGSGHHG